MLSGQQANMILIHYCKLCSICKLAACYTGFAQDIFLSLGSGLQALYLAAGDSNQAFCDQMEWLCDKPEEG